jgi:hypothetical protein
LISIDSYLVFILLLKVIYKNASRNFHCYFKDVSIRLHCGPNDALRMHQGCFKVIRMLWGSFEDASMVLWDCFNHGFLRHASTLFMEESRIILGYFLHNSLQFHGWFKNLQGSIILWFTVLTNAFCSYCLPKMILRHGPLTVRHQLQMVHIVATGALNFVSVGWAPP